MGQEVAGRHMHGHSLAIVAAVERLLEVFEDVVDRLEADRESDEAVGEA